MFTRPLTFNIQLFDALQRTLTYSVPQITTYSTASTTLNSLLLSPRRHRTDLNPQLTTFYSHLLSAVITNK